MILIKERLLILKGRRQRISNFVVWWQTPVGLCETLEEAIKACENRDWNPEELIRPVCVAVTDSGDYEVCGS